ncbi:O-antigen ligase family protein [Clostridium tertium]
MKIIVIFAIVTATVTWISYFFPSFYINNISNIFSNDSKSEVIRYFTVNRHYMGLTNHYSRNAFYIVSALIFLTPSILSRLTKRINIIIYMYLILTLLLIGKRGHGLFFALSFCIMILFNEKSRQKRIRSIIKWLFISVIVFILIIVFIPQVNTLFIRLTMVSNNVTSGREGLYQIAFDMFKRSPIIGNGYGSFAREVNFTFAGVHNDYLQILAENGVFGFLIMIGFNLYCYIYSIKAIRITNYENNYAKVSFMFQTFILLYSFTGLPRYDYEVMTLYLIMCIWGVEIFRSNNRRKGN